MKQVRIQNDVIELSPNRQELINISRPIFHSSVTFTSNLERDFEDLDRVTRDCSEILKTSPSLDRLWCWTGNPGGSGASGQFAAVLWTVCGK